MGRQIKKIELAYIAGFLDGDGSIMVQIKNRRDTRRGWRIMLTICLYQDSRHESPLLWMRDLFDIGYISRRKDGITEYRINGYQSVEVILRQLKSFVRFKKTQVDLAIKLAKILRKKKFLKFSKSERVRIAETVCDIRESNYKSGMRKYTRSEIIQLLSF